MPVLQLFKIKFWEQMLLQIEDKNGPSSFVVVIVVVNHSSWEYFPGYPTNMLNSMRERNLSMPSNSL